MNFKFIYIFPLFLTILVNNTSYAGKEYVSSQENPLISVYRVEDSDLREVIEYQDYVIAIKIEDRLIAGFDVYKRIGDKSYRFHVDKVEPIFSSPRHEGAWFYGIYQHFLFIDYGFDPSLRGLEIFNLKTRKKLFSGNHMNEPIEFVEKNKIVVYKSLNKSEISESVVSIKFSQIERALDLASGMKNWTYGYLKGYILDLTTGKLEDTTRLNVWISH